MFERLSAEPIYNTRAVVRRTGVPADTFRAWERRYGVPSPLRTEGNQRLYSERDIRQITWLREQTALGLTISQAIQLMRTAWPSVPGAVYPLPGMIEGSIEEVLTGRKSDGANPLMSARRRLVDAFTHLDGQAAEHILQETFAWADFEAVLVEVLHGAAVDVRSRPDLAPPASPVWHFTRTFVHRKLSALLNYSNPNDGRGPIMSAGVAGEESDLTLLLSAVFLSRAGYRVVILGPDLPLEAFLNAVQIVRPAVVCLAASTEKAAMTLVEWQDKIANMNGSSGVDWSRVRICYSGRVFLEQPGLRNQIQGKFLGHSAQDAVAVVESAMAGG